MKQSFSAPAKIILFGEHAVVYGRPAIAVPIGSLRATAEIETSAGGLRLIADNLNETVKYRPDSEHVLAQAAGLILKQLQADPPPVTIRLRSDIPIASGLGSGTAISSVLGRALSAATGVELSTADLNAVVFDIEKIHHGTPSGIDNTVIVYDQAVYFQHEKPIERLVLGAEVSLIVADTGQPALTEIAVGDLRRRYNENPAAIIPILDEVGQIVVEARAALESGELPLLGTLMLHNHEFLRQLTVSSSELDLLVSTAQQAGAWGAKMSGGGRGGNMIAIAAPDAVDSVMQSLRNAGAARVFSTTLGVQAGR
jgi:mevalonate kinase